MFAGSETRGQSMDDVKWVDCYVVLVVNRIKRSIPQEWNNVEIHCDFHVYTLSYLINFRILEKLPETENCMV